MKKINLRLQNMLPAMAFLMLAIVSCGKDEGVEDKKDDIPQTPKFEHINLNTKYSPTDLRRSDTTVKILSKDLKIEYVLNGLSGNNNEVTSIKLDFGNNTYFHVTEKSLGNNSVTYIVTSLEKNIVIDTTTSNWAYYNPLSIYAEFSNGRFAKIDTNKDVYIPFRTKIDEQSYKYGWLLLNLSSDLRTVTIKEAAISLEENKVIKTGEK